MNSTILIAIVGFVLSAVVAYIVGRRLGSGDDISLRKVLQEREQKIEQQGQEILQLTAQRDVERSRREQLELQLEQTRQEAQRSLNEQLSQLKEFYEREMTQMRETSERLVAQLKEMNEKQVESQMALIREQMQTTSERVLKARQEELGAQNIEQVAKIVDPINTGLRLMREALDSSQKEHQQTMTHLDATIRANMERSTSLGETADRLTRALLGKTKVQGNFGELKLKQLLEDLGLKENEQYTTQQTLTTRYGKSIKSDEDRRLVPDFILHFPGNRDIIVDSKVSLVSYEQYVNAEDELQRNDYLAAHIKSVRDHVKGLARKDYSRYLDAEYSKLNFVIMYMFHEGALNLALVNDTALWRDAYDQGVLIMGPQTMYMNLRVLELMWTQSRQLQYQKAIIKEAELIIERVQLFAKRFKDIEGCLTATRESFDSLKLLMADSGKSIITPARNLIAYGVKESKSTTSKRGKNSKVSLSEVALEGEVEEIAEDDVVEEIAD